MFSPPDLPGPDPASLAQRIGTLATGLLVAFLVAVLASVLPPRLLDATWQWSFSGSLIDNAPVAAVALGLLHLAVYLDPGNERLAARLRTLSRWAVPAALGFLLLLPLQAASVWNSYRQLEQARSSQLTEVRDELRKLRQAVRSASSSADLLALLPRDLLPALGPAPLTQPLPRLQRRTGELIDAAAARAGADLEQQPAQRFFMDAGRRSLRVFISALAYAAIFATLGQARPGGLTDALLGEWRIRVAQIDALLHGGRLSRQEQEEPAKNPGEENVNRGGADGATDDTSMIP